MKRKFVKTIFCICFVATPTIAVDAASAPAIQFITNESDVRHDGVINWSDFARPLPATVPVHGLAGLTASVTQHGTGSAQGMGPITQDPSSPSAGGFWGGSFAPNENLLWTGFGPNGPMTFSFSSPVAQAGLQIQGGWYGRFVADLMAFDSNGSLLASFTRTGISADTADNTAPFIGVVSVQSNIAKLIIDVEPYSNFGHYFAIDGPVVSFVSIPEPTTALLATISLLMLPVRRSNR